MDRVFTTSQAAREICRSGRWLREAEAKGLIPKARRDLNGWRVYTEEDIAILENLLVPRRDSQDITQPNKPEEPTPQQ